MAEIVHTCERCGAELPAGKTCRDLYNELSLYTLAHPDPRFLHQHIVDAYGASHVGPESKLILGSASLIGLYLFVEKGYTGKQVQNAHVELGNNMKEWPRFVLPKEKASITVLDALRAREGEERDRVIEEWARAVWDMWKSEHETVRASLGELR